MTIPYALTIFVLAVKIKFIIILLVVLTLNEIHVIRKKANEQSLYCKMCAKISLH